MNENDILYIEEKLKKYGANVYNYQGTSFIGIKNPYSDNNLAITFRENENVMEFTFQSARFAKNDLDGLILHTERFLKNELCAAEFFINGKSIFGGSRPTAGSDFSDFDELARWYTLGNEQAVENLKKFVYQNGVLLKLFSWNGKFDRTVTVKPDGKTEDLNI